MGCMSGVQLLVWTGSFLSTVHKIVCYLTCITSSDAYTWGILKKMVHWNHVLYHVFNWKKSSIWSWGNYTVQSLPWRANSHSANQEILLLWQNPSFITIFLTACHWFLFLSQINPGHNLPSYVFKIHFNIILPIMLRFSKWSLLSRFSNQNVVMYKILVYTIRAVQHNNISEGTTK
jgi:hypothetical protein